MTSPRRSPGHLRRELGLVGLDAWSRAEETEKRDLRLACPAGSASLAARHDHARRRVRQQCRAGAAQEEALDRREAPRSHDQEIGGQLTRDDRPPGSKLDVRSCRACAAPVDPSVANRMRMPAIARNPTRSRRLDGPPRASSTAPPC
jgi:hypothetical protein